MNIFRKFDAFEVIFARGVREILSKREYYNKSSPLFKHKKKYLEWIKFRVDKISRISLFFT